VLDNTGESEEHPEDIQLGEAFMARITHAVMTGKNWHRTLLVWLYDEHGGYYDHVAPPTAPAPDTMRPLIGAGDAPGNYTLYGPRVPAVVISPYSKAHEVTNVVHDHTSVLATIEQQWNLPALTFRDANAASLIDFLDPSTMSFPEPPDLAAPANPLPELLQSYSGTPLPPKPTP
jgi:phospholipase C